MAGSPHPFIIVLIFLAAFTVLWLGIVMFGARYGGWGTLAKLYSGPLTIQGEVCTYSSARMRWFYGYSRCLTVTVSDKGIHMRPMLAFRLHHPPLLIPWNAVLDMRDRSLALFPRLDLTIHTDDPEQPLVIAYQGKRLVEALRRHGPARISI